MSSKAAKWERESHSKLNQLEEKMERLIIQNEDLTRKVEKLTALLDAAQSKQAIFPLYELSKKRRYLLGIGGLFVFSTIVLFWEIVEPFTFLFTTPWFKMLAALYAAGLIFPADKPLTLKVRWKRLVSLLGIQPRGRDSP